jgi:hypothetical protein
MDDFSEMGGGGKADAGMDVSSLRSQPHLIPLLNEPAP